MEPQPAPQEFPPEKSESLPVKFQTLPQESSPESLEPLPQEMDQISSEDSLPSQESALGYMPEESDQSSDESLEDSLLLEELAPWDDQLQQEIDQSSVDSPPSQESPPRPTIVCLDTAAKLAHKLVDQWYKESGKQPNDDINEVNVSLHSRPSRLELGAPLRESGDEDEDGFGSWNVVRRMSDFDPSDLSQYAGRYVPATRPTESESLDDKEDSDAPCP